MQKLLSLICLLGTVVTNAATYTFHCTKDFGADVIFDDPVWQNYNSVFLYWDYPNVNYSGISWVNNNVPQPYLGYSDVLTVTVPDDWLCGEIWISSGDPDYFGGAYLVDWQLLAQGEYWIDYGSGGVARLSTTQPADFGKWDWDGSINPSWVASKKGYAKGHNRFPLPSPK